MSNISKNLTDARKQIDRNPTQGQIEAGNYSKGHVKILGFNITIENPKGSYRKGKDKNGHEWKTLMHNDYGYFVRTLGKDGDAIDVFIGPNLKSEKIYPIDQFINGEFDETKVMLGFDSKEEAKKAYLSNYDKNWKGFKYITEVDIDTFKKWLYDGHRQRKPFAKYVTLTESKHKVVKNDKGETVPEKCDKCGGDVVVQIHGEPVYICKKCGKYFGTVPFKCNIKENINIKKALKSLKKRRDPANIENWDNMKNIKINESQLRQIIRESIEEFYKGSQKESAAYENACDCLYFGYGFKFWFERNAELLDNDIEFAKKVWQQAVEDMGNR